MTVVLFFFGETGKWLVYLNVSRGGKCAYRHLTSVWGGVVWSSCVLCYSQKWSRSCRSVLLVHLLDLVARKMGRTPSSKRRVSHRVFVETRVAQPLLAFRFVLIEVLFLRRDRIFPTT